SGYTLLMHYSHARWLADHSDEAGIGRNKVNRLKGYLMSDSIAYFLREILGIPDFRTAKPEDIKKLIEELNIGDIIDLLIDAPSQLIEALAFLRPGYFKNVSVTEFVKAYIGLNVEQERQGTDRAGVDEWDKRRLYILAVIKAIEANDELDLSEAKFKQQVSLLMRLSRKSFEQNADQLLAELDTQAQEATHPFVKRLHEAVASHFRLIQSFEVTGMRTAPYAYQREGTRFLVSHQRAILADEAGLGKTFQATAAVQTLGLKRVLWITTASNKEAVRDDIMEHAEVGMDAIKIVISGDVAERKKQFAALNGERYIITNYETLVALKKTDPEAYAKLTEDLDVVIVDEAQLTDNVKTLRSSAVRDIPCNRRWLLSASPYQSNPERIWTLLNYLDPEKYPSRQAFKEMFTTTTGGLLLLHGELTDMMLRRTKQETMTHFTNPAESPFAEQLADGVPRLPKKIRVTPEVSGAYALAPEQADLIAWMIADYRGWINYFNENLPDGAERIESDAVNSLHKFQMIHKVIYEPEYFGLDCENPLYPALDQMVARHLAKDEKVILWCWNTELITTLQKRYAQFGVSRIDGSVMGEAREKARHEFQNDPHVRIMDANYLSGGVGLTLTAAHSAIFVQLPHVFPPLYQAEGRHHRLIGPHKIQFAKEHVFVEWMVPTYHAGFVDSIDDERLMEKLTHGTLVEQTRRRLEGGELLYNLVMEGYGDLEDLEEYFKLGVMEAMGLNDAEALDYVPQLPTKVRAYAKTARALLPLWKLVSGVAEARDQVLHLVDVLRFYPQLANQIGQAFEQAGVCHTSDLGYINALFEIRNKYVREQIIKRIPSLIINLYAQGVALTQTAKELDLDVKSPLAFLAQVCVVGHVGARAILQTAQELAHLRSSPSKRYIEEHFYVGVLAVLENDAVKSFLEAHSVLFEGAPLLERVHVLYRIGLLCRLQKATIGTFADKQYSSFKDMAKDIERAINQAIATFTSQPIESVEEMLVANPHWRGNADPILALFVGYQEFGNVALLNQAREVFSHVVDNDLTEWRMGENNREHGTSIDYLSDDEDFWNSYARPLQTTMPQFEVTTNRMNRALVRQYIALISEYEQDGVTVEGPWVQQELKAFRALVSPVDKERQIAHYQQELSVLGALLGRTEMNAEAMALIEKYNLQTNGTVLSKESLLLKVTELRNLLGWMLLDREFTAVNKGNEPDWQVINRQLEFKAKIYSRSKQAKTAEHYDALIDAVAMRAKGGQKFYDVDIVDTDDAATMTRMGALHPEMVNCFNSNGNPTFNQYVVTALASKNMRLVVVSARLQPGGPKQVVAAAMCKVKALEDDEPVLFLERGLYRLGYDFRNEMLAHLIMKKAQMEETSTQQLVVMDEVFGRAKDRDLHVHGIGAFTENEYVEPVFGLRRSGHINHLGRIANINPAQNHTVQQPLSQVVGTGMLGCSWEQYVAQLKAQSVTVVVDVRERPYMRNPKMQAYNRNQMAPALEKEGIEYIWLGDTLGNPKVNGARTLEGFREQHMKTQVYRQGKEQLLEIMRRAKGKVSLTCVESEASECHRTLIIEDL
ncbi:MAG: helicase, SNF2 family, partial [uncultured bacterium]